MVFDTNFEKDDQVIDSLDEACPRCDVKERSPVREPTFLLRCIFNQ
jgi:hypothetical protein